MQESTETIYKKIRDEILTLGWSKILEKYHPENNIEDSKALERFNLYKGVYKTMKAEANLAYHNNKKFYIEHQQKYQADIIYNYQNIIRKFYILSIIIVIFVMFMIIFKTL